MSRRPFVLLLALALAGCDAPPDLLQGWIEANLIFVGPDEAGRVATLSVREGDVVAKGAPLFALDTELQDADLGIAQASRTNAQRTFERADELLKSKVGSQKAYDDALAQQRDTQARLDAANTRLARRKVASQVIGTVQQIYFRPGELVGAGKPVLALLPPGNLRVRFFVPQDQIARVALGDRLAVSCDGCAEGLTAKVSFLSRQVEFTPPVIYSFEERSKLVFLVEAIPDQPEKVRVGQPVRVRVEATNAAEARR